MLSLYIEWNKMLSRFVARVSTDRRVIMKAMYLRILCFSRINFLCLTTTKKLEFLLLEKERTSYLYVFT